MTEAELIGLGGALGAGCRQGFGLLLARGVRDLSANLIGPFVLVLGVHVGLAQTLPSGGRAAIASGALGGYMLVSTLRAAHAVLGEAARTLAPWRR
jgi:fluoride ion exporter CrcB/FEX